MSKFVKIPSESEDCGQNIINSFGAKSGCQSNKYLSKNPISGQKFYVMFNKFLSNPIYVKIETLGQMSGYEYYSY